MCYMQRLLCWNGRMGRYWTLSCQPLIPSSLTNSTRDAETSHETKWLLKGMKRIRVGENLTFDVGSNCRRKNISNLEFGCISPPNLYE